MNQKQTTILSEKQTLDLLEKYKIPIADFRICYNIEELISSSKNLEFPITIKGMAEGIAHKSDLGLVKTDIKSEEDLLKAVKEIQNNAQNHNLSGFLLQKHIYGKRELIIGGMKHNEYGVCVYIGIGGIFVEAIEDVSFRSAPISEIDLQEMIYELHFKKIFNSFRGDPPIDTKKIFLIIKSIENLLSNEAEISQFELNPILIHRDTPIAVDALAVKGNISIKNEQTERTSLDFNTLLKLFEPESIAIVGITDTPIKWGFRVLFNTLEGGYTGKIYGVNPKRSEVLNIPCYPSILDLPEVVDLAVIIVPPPTVLPSVQECIQKGIQVVLVITAGFGELNNEEAQTSQEKLKQIAHENNLYLIGPNCAGVVSPYPKKLYCSMIGRYPQPGGLSILSQSGNIGNTIMSWAMEHHLGLSRFISTGNEAVIKNYHYLNFFGSDPKTKVIFSYIESAKDIRLFFNELKKTTRKKPVIILKGGKTQAGSRAASSHTGALATDYRLFRGICIQQGAILTEDVYEATETAYLLSNVPLPRGRNVGILSQGGGWGVISADVCTKVGLNVIPLSENTLKKLDAIMPKWWNRTNPVDMVAGTDRNLFKNSMEILIQDDEVDILVILGIGYIGSAYVRLQNSERAKHLGLDKLSEIGTHFEIKDAEEITRLMQTYQKPIVVASDTTILSHGQNKNPVLKKLEEMNIYVFQNPTNMAKAIAHLCRYSEYLRNTPRIF
ncbi:MAG: acetate--CoA ligase family protein [Candidatus Hydrogenedens sp.]|nr:acetate--CoA ligase family protein [Candidatus Hydrogenedens sp.]